MIHNFESENVFIKLKNKWIFNLFLQNLDLKRELQEQIDKKYKKAIK